MSNRPGLFELSMPDDDQHTLKLCKVKSSDVGQLTCIASNKYGSDTCTLTLEMAGMLLAVYRIQTVCVSVIIAHNLCLIDFSVSSGTNF